MNDEDGLEILILNDYFEMLSSRNIRQTQEKRNKNMDEPLVTKKST